MLQDLLYVVWDVNPVLFNIGGFELRYYGLMWAFAILFGERLIWAFAKREGFSQDIVETGFIWIVLGAILGSRVGHCLFYEFSYYVTKPWAILTEIRNGGMASHGAAIGMLIGMWITARKHKMAYVWWLDRIMIPVAIGGAAVRLGNLINSEIIGNVTEVPWAFQFVKLYPGVALESMPAHHPAQLYEAICYLITFGVLMWMYYGRDVGRRHAGLMFGVGLIGIFLTRFLLELLNLDQEAFEAGMFFNMGQLLSIPFVIAAGVMIWGAMKNKFPVAVPPAKVKAQSAINKRNNKK